ncbi:unnamed protein product [Gongylonema pulchrum]|uniref:Uncharacterized protein n=1 Tax=Gongylonema pulchrum TaxID=637853 RepID=A0A183EEJ9_9BILA|nr:unnamed protein product [Gongylonema pulchrum]
MVAHTVSQKSKEYNRDEVEKELAKLREQENEVKTARENLCSDEKTIAKGRERCRRKMDEFLKKKGTRNVIEQQLRSKLAKLHVMEKNKPDLDTAKETLENANTKIIDDTFLRAGKIAALLRRNKAQIASAFCAFLEMRAANVKCKEFMERVEQFKIEYDCAWVSRLKFLKLFLW